MIVSDYDNDLKVMTRNRDLLFKRLAQVQFVKDQVEAHYRQKIKSQYQRIRHLEKRVIQLIEKIEDSNNAGNGGKGE